MLPRLLLACLLATALAAADPAVAMVGEEAITAARLAAGIPTGLFGQTRTFARQSRLEQLIAQTALRQRLLALGAAVDEAAVDRAFAEAVKQPPTLGCGCCVYSSYDDYLAQTFQTRDDARLAIWLDQAVAAYAAATWEREHPAAAGATAAVDGAEGRAIRDGSRLAWNLGFDFAAGEDPFHPKPGSAMWNRAAAALARIRGGAAFDAVAAQEDPASVHQDLRGVATPTGMLAGLGVDAAQLAQHPAGLVAEPVAVNGRWQIVRWEPLGDAAVLAELKERHLDAVRGRVQAEAKQVPVRYLGDGLALAPKPPPR